MPYGAGTFPWESPVLVDPLDPSGTRFGYFGAASPGDFNGDGLPDLVFTDQDGRWQVRRHSGSRPDLLTAATDKQ